MTYMAIAVGVIGVGILLLVAYLVVGQVKQQYVSMGLNDTNISTAMETTQSTVFAGFGLLAVGIIVLAAFGIISVFR